ncbi:MAG: mannose-1-phosphate guanylyltransferase [Candidatus Kerfeldbacteria bacterium]|nr:mannose-1-phosphate guanylyltransferase [Candidatus Kerfeldbacteria bacterium]
MNIVILAGGGGTRLWPVSRKKNPKQAQPFIGTKTLLQVTYARQRKGFPIKDIFISSNVTQYPLIKKQLPSVPRRNYILETAKRDTAPAIGLAAVSIHKRNPHGIMMSVGSDHFIKDERAYIRLAKLAEQIIKKNPEYSLLIGVRPTYPEIGYGYVKINKLFSQVGQTEIFYGERFVEKPDLVTAKKYAHSWDYLWNTNMFCWRVDTLLAMYQRYLPEHYRRLMIIQRAIGTSREQAVIKKEFAQMRAVSIDYAIMEKTKKMLVLPATFDWTDVGHWRTVHEVLAQHPHDNIIRGQHIGIDSKSNLIFSYTGRLIGTAGLERMIVIDMEDALLICSQDRAHDVKKIVAEIEKKKLDKYL